MPRSKGVDQIAMDEKVIQDDAVLRLLERAENAKVEAAATRAHAKETKAAAIAALEAYPLEEGHPWRRPGVHRRRPRDRHHEARLR